MEHIAPIIVGLLAAIASIGSAFFVYNKNKTTIELELGHQTDILGTEFGHKTEALGTQIDHLQETLELKLRNIDAKVDDVCAKVTVVEAKVNENIQETSKIKVKVGALEKDVEVLKKGSTGYVKI